MQTYITVKLHGMKNSENIPTKQLKSPQFTPQLKNIMKPRFNIEQQIYLILLVNSNTF